MGSRSEHLRERIRSTWHRRDFLEARANQAKQPKTIEETVRDWIQPLRLDTRSYDVAQGVLSRLKLLQDSPGVERSHILYDAGQREIFMAVVIANLANKQQTAGAIRKANKDMRGWPINMSFASQNEVPNMNPQSIQEIYGHSVRHIGTITKHPVDHKR